MTTPSIQLTDRAAAHVRKFLAREGNDLGLRVGVKPTGCSGYKYVVVPAESVQDGDLRFESNGVALVVAGADLPFLAGMELDFVREGLNEGFRFNNPNVQAACGCGESVSFAGPGGPAH